jgi:hypothetical protein
MRKRAGSDGERSGVMSFYIKEVLQQVRGNIFLYQRGPAAGEG